MGVRVVLNNAGLHELMRDEKIRAELHRRAEKVLAEAKATAPVESSHYRDTLVVEDHEYQKRAVSRVESRAHYGMQVEAAHGTLSRALDAAAGA